MPPFLANDPVAAARGVEAGWLAVAAAVLQVASEGWALALVALALYSWLERGVPAVVKAFLPALLAIAGAHALGGLLDALSGVPRPVGAGGAGPLDLLRRVGAPGGPVLAVAAFAAYSLAVYRRRGAAALLLALLASGAAIATGAPWPLVLAGMALGAAVGLATWAVVVRAFPRGHLARLRAERAARASPRAP